MCNRMQNPRIKIIEICLTLHSLPITFFATSCTFAEARATAVSAMISTMGVPSPLVIDRCMKLSNTMSISSGTCVMISQFVIIKPANYLH
jgi:hypothetical protein